MLSFDPLSVWGPAGFIIVVMGGVIRYLYNELKAERNARLGDLQNWNATLAKVTKENARKESILYRKIQATQSGVQ